MNDERRKATRLRVEIPTTVEAIAATAQDLPPELEAVYERVQPTRADVGKPPAMFIVRDISSNGAFLEGPPVALMSRIRFKLPIGGANPEAIGWVLWRRVAPCTVGNATLEPGIGVLFEAFPLDMRIEISKLAHAEKK
jgi:hypothetical protein